MGAPPWYSNTHLHELVEGLGGKGVTSEESGRFSCMERESEGLQFALFTLRNV